MPHQWCYILSPSQELWDSDYKDLKDSIWSLPHMEFRLVGVILVILQGIHPRDCWNYHKWLLCGHGMWLPQRKLLRVVGMEVKIGSCPIDTLF